uniref:Uncharacterized protein n=1 Tax=Rhizophora mucronata TaxID=61149 RepID=A0A2P2PYG5_RHIMU
MHQDIRDHSMTQPDLLR